MPLDTTVTLDSTTWAALALVLSLVGVVLSWVAWRRRGVAAGIRGLAWSLIPIAAWLTGTLRLLANVINDVVAWGARLVFSPVVWLGIVVAGVAAALWVVSGVMRARGIGVREPVAGRSLRRSRRARAVDAGAAGSAGSKGAKRAPTGSRKGADDIEDLDDIEAILKRHGI